MKPTLILLLFSTFLLLNSEGYAQKQKAKIKARAVEKKRQESKSNVSSSSNTTTAVAAQQQPTQRTTPSSPPPSSGRSRVRYSSATGFNQGDKLLNIGVGVSSYGNGNPVGLSFESGVNENFSVGGQFDYKSGNDDFSGSRLYGYSTYYLGVRGSYHVNRLLHINNKDIDLYAGIGLGYQRFSWNNDAYNSSYYYGYGYRSGLYFNYFIGGKYYFTDKIGGFLELGNTGLSTARVGLAFKF